MRKEFTISIVWQIAALMLVFITGVGPAYTALNGEHAGIDVVSSATAADQDHTADETSAPGDHDKQEVVSALNATLPVAPLHINVLSGFGVVHLPRIELTIPHLPKAIAPATRVYFKTLFRRIISPNAP